VTLFTDWIKSPLERWPKSSKQWLWQLTLTLTGAVNSKSYRLNYSLFFINIRKIACVSTILTPKRKNAYKHCCLAHIDDNLAEKYGSGTVCIVSFLTRCCFYFATFYLEKSRHENRQYYAFTRRFVDVSNAGAPIFDSRPNLKKKCVTPRGLFSIQIDRRPGNLSVILNTLD